jgi:hypothetical protein
MKSRLMAAFTFAVFVVLALVSTKANGPWIWLLILLGVGVNAFAFILHLCNAMAGTAPSWGDSSKGAGTATAPVNAV